MLCKYRERVEFIYFGIGGQILSVINHKCKHLCYVSFENRQRFDFIGIHHFLILHFLRVYVGCKYLVRITESLNQLHILVKSDIQFISTLYSRLPNKSYEFSISNFQWNIFLSALKGLTQHFKILTTHFIETAPLLTL